MPHSRCREGQTCKRKTNFKIVMDLNRPRTGRIKDTSFIIDTAHKNTDNGSLKCWSRIQDTGYRGPNTSPFFFHFHEYPRDCKHEGDWRLKH